MLNSSPDHIIICDIESTHKIVSCAEIITIAFIKVDLKLNIVDKRSWKMAPLLWNEMHDEAASIHKITREQAMSYPEKKQVLREIYQWFGKGVYYFAGHFNRDVFGMRVSFDYALLKQEFWDQSSEAYFQFGQRFPRQYICSTHSLAKEAFRQGLIDVPLEIKYGNDKASRDYGLKNICKIMKVELGNHHDAEVDALAAYYLLKKFSDILNIFEVIKNDWRVDYEQGDNSGKTGRASGIEVHQWWSGSSEFLSGDIGEVD